MKKKGFTLVELLAVIAILAILVIVAMPNVLGMFNDAKLNTFVTEVQKYMDSAKTAFMTEALSKPAQDIIFTNVKTKEATPTQNAGTEELDMEGTKNYYIVMNRSGQYTKIVIWDSNFCYEKNANIEKTDVVASEVKESKPADGITFDTDNKTVKTVQCAPAS